ncbi:trigger factor [Aminivibrio sp.]|uniref:trigger factor n=1 Tax=Aminivibrio sp. TaxID=1872489 RepID=UPI001A421241|nr:trigger factor [Aminivibrio sp.]MBL3540607.1 trigger factor [Aminivibrio sp.]
MLSQEKNVLSIKVEFEPEEFAKNVDKTVKEIASKVNIPGFRKGHAPRKVLEMRFGKTAIFAEAFEAMLPDAIEEIVKDYELDLIDEPSVKIEKMEEGSPVEVVLTFEVSPEITLPPLEDISVERAVADVSDETLEGTIQEILKQNSTLVPVEGRPISGTDTVAIEYFTILLGENGEEERHGPDTTTLDLSQPSVRTEIKDALLGKETGAQAEAEVMVEEDYPEKNLAGKTLRYEMTVTEVKERVLPDLTPEFFHKILQKECASEDEFREEIRKIIHESMQAENQSMAEYDAVELISGKADLEVPETLISRQVEVMKKEEEERIQHDRNISMDEYLKETGTTKEEYEEKIRKQAETIVRRSLVLDKIAEDLKVSVEKEDFEAEMELLASTYKIDADRLVKSLFKDEKRLIEVANRIKYKKTVKAIMEAVRVTDAAAPQTEEHNKNG